jgi:hypothetical protein
MGKFQNVSETSIRLRSFVVHASTSSFFARLGWRVQIALRLPEFKNQMSLKGPPFARVPLLAHPHMLRHACGFALADQGADTPQKTST